MRTAARARRAPTRRSGGRRTWRAASSRALLRRRARTDLDPSRAPTPRAQKSSLDCWDALTDMQRGGLLVEGDTDAEFRLRDCTQIGHAKRACELWNLC